MRSSIQNRDQQLLERVREGDERLLSELYADHRSPFVRWAMKQFRSDEDEATDLYQKAFTIFYLNVKDGKLTDLTSSIRTYIIGIGKRVAYDHIKKEHRRIDNVELEPEIKYLDYQFLDSEHESHIQSVIKDLLENLDGTCRKILKLYYFSKYSMESIANSMNYKNDKVAKKKKYQCLGKLRQMIIDQGISQSGLLDR